MSRARFGHWSWIFDVVDDLPGARAADQPAWDAVVLWIGDRMFGLLCTDGRGRELLTLKLPPDQGAALRDEHAFVEPGWHLNKRHWTSVVLTDAVRREGADAGRELVTAWIEDSHACLLAALPRWRRAEVLTGVPRPDTTRRPQERMTT